METKAKSERLRPRTREGVVLKDGMQKTRIVSVTRLYRDSQFQKVVKRRMKYAVHDEKNESHVGDRVRMIETRPSSGTKRWRVVGIVKKQSQ